MVLQRHARRPAPLSSCGSRRSPSSTSSALRALGVSRQLQYHGRSTREAGGGGHGVCRAPVDVRVPTVRARACSCCAALQHRGLDLGSVLTACVRFAPPSRAVVPSAGRTDRVNDWSAADFRAALRSLPGPVGTAPAVLLEHAPCAPLRCGCTVQPPASDIARLFAQVGERLGASSGRRASLAQRWRGQEPRRGTCCCEHQRPVHGGRYERFASLDGRLERGRPHGRGTSLPRQQRQRGW